MKEVKNILPKFSEEDEKIVEYQLVIGGFRRLERPTLSSELTCKICGGKDHTTFRKECNEDSSFIWFCKNTLCEAVLQKLTVNLESSPTLIKRCVEWPLFCELNNIGDSYHNVKFENLTQSQGKIDYLKKFAETPKGIIFMYGDTGTGKTYSSLAVCEFFTRKNNSAIVITQKTLAENWIHSMINPGDNFRERMKTVKILVIDDFGTAEMTPNFLSIFMDLINTRMQWNDRGTIITTNLNNDKFAIYCGDALSDRINTGQHMKFEGKSNRKSNVL